MVLFRKASALQEYLRQKRAAGLRTGFVPTMGALHEGHLSLIRQASADNDLAICSIFVNPTQFNDPADFAKYPVTTATDTKLLLQAGCNVLFLPSVEEMYPAEDIPAAPHVYDLGYLETILEGAYRPGHFQGVCQVIERFLTIVEPEQFYLGQKDFQQCMVVRRLVELLGMEDRIRFTIAPTLREPDGLAMSSRNIRLSPEERAVAPIIFRVLSGIRSQTNRSQAERMTVPAGPDSVGQGVNATDLNEITNTARNELIAAGLRPDYVSIADARDLRPVISWDGTQPLVAMVAAFLGEVRLIDNLLLTMDKPMG